MAVQLQYYTFYLTNGKRKVFMGYDAHDAYVNNQSKEDVKVPIAICEKGITNEYTWDDRDNTWIAKIHTTLIRVSDTAMVSDLTLAFLTSDHVNVEFANKDVLSYGVKWGHFAFGWTHYIEISYGEYQAGTYGDYDNGISTDHHYLTMGTQYFSVEDKETAIRIFADRVLSDKPHVAIPDTKCQSLEEIHDNMALDKIYTNLNNQQQVVLLGSLINRLQQYEHINRFIKKGFIRRPSSTECKEVQELYEHIMYYCDRYLITSEGHRDSGNEGILTQLFGYQFTVGESDAFGVLSMVIRTNAGKLVYG